MGKKLPSEQLKFYVALDSFLFKEWDPIGVSGLGCPDDEYHAYLPVVFKMLMANASSDEIAKYLDRVVTERMGLNSNFEHSFSIAKKVLELKIQMVPDKQT